MRTAIYWIICIIFLVFGLMRLCVGSALFVNELGVIDIDGLSEVVAEVHEFIEKKQGQQLVDLTALSYVGVITFMGLSLSLGAVGAMRRKAWGLVLIGVYLLTHAGLFMNFQTVNRKIVYFILGIMLYVVLIWMFTKSTSDASEVD